MDVFLERQKVRKKKRWLVRLRQAERVLLSLAIVLGGLAGVYGLYRVTVLGPTFGVDKIVVGGDLRYLDADELANLSGVARGDNLFWTSVSEVHRRIESNPWVKATAVRRHLPDTLWIYVEEHVPLAMTAGEGLFYVDADGNVFKRVAEGDSKDFPVLSGMGMHDGDVLDEDRERMLDMLRLVALVSGSEFMSGQKIDEVHYDRDAGYSLVISRIDPGPGPASSTMQIFLGHTALDDRVQRIDRMHEAISGRGRILYMVADKPKGVVVKYQPS